MISGLTEIRSTFTVLALTAFTFTVLKRFLLINTIVRLSLMVLTASRRFLSTVDNTWRRWDAASKNNKQVTEQDVVTEQKRQIRCSTEWKPLTKFSSKCSMEKNRPTRQRQQDNGSSLERSHHARCTTGENATRTLI